MENMFYYSKIDILDVYLIVVGGIFLYLVYCVIVLGI